MEMEVRRLRALVHRRADQHLRQQVVLLLRERSYPQFPQAR